MLIYGEDESKFNITSDFLTSFELREIKIWTNSNNVSVKYRYLFNNLSKYKVKFVFDSADDTEKFIKALPTIREEAKQKLDHSKEEVNQWNEQNYYPLVRNIGYNGLIRSEEKCPDALKCYMFWTCIPINNSEEMSNLIQEIREWAWKFKIDTIYEFDNPNENIIVSFTSEKDNKKFKNDILNK